MLYNVVMVSAISSVSQFSRSVVSDCSWPHESQHARPPCPSPTPGIHSDSRPSSQWCHPAIQQCKSSIIVHISPLSWASSPSPSRSPRWPPKVVDVFLTLKVTFSTSSIWSFCEILLVKSPFGVHVKHYKRIISKQGVCLIT